MKNENPFFFDSDIQTFAPQAVTIKAPDNFRL